MSTSRLPKLSTSAPIKRQLPFTNPLEAGGDNNHILIEGGSIDAAFDAVFAPGACNCQHTP